MNNNILLGLNQEQFAAIVDDSNAMLVLAGAGSGKTRVLTTKIAYLLQQNRCTQRQIMAVTFTNKAAAELKQRIAKLLNQSIENMFVGTFHAIGLRILFKYHKEANLLSSFKVIDMNEQLNILKQILQDLNLSEDTYNIRTIQRYINNQKELIIRSKFSTNDNYKIQIYNKIYGIYEEICLRDSIVDFSEILLRTYELFINYPNILVTYQQQFKYILVDEFQDTNYLQYNWIKLLKGHDTSLFVVGDDDQSIYSFRGAKAANMQLFLQDYLIDRPIKLQQNYRSKSYILEAANNLISKNQDRIGKILWSNDNFDNKIKFYSALDEEHESQYVIEQIKFYRDQGINLNDIVILYRSNAQSRIFEQYLYQSGIPYLVYGGLRFFDRSEIKIMLFYLRLVLNTNDNASFLKIINFPPRGVGEKTIEKIKSIALDHNISLLEALLYVDLSSKLKNTVNQFYNMIFKLQLFAGQNSLVDLINLIINDVGIKDYYQKDNDENSRLENLSQLITVANDFESDLFGLDKVNEFVSFMYLNEVHVDDKNKEQKVNLMTIHSAKGLEFDLVFVTGLEEGLFPHDNSLNTNSIEEERRLMYVAITRAKKFLYMTRATTRLIWGKRNYAFKSRFISEIPNNIIEEVNLLANKADVVLDVLNNDLDYVIKTEFSIGDIVKHNKFGNGKIIDIKAHGNRLVGDIFFIGIGKKTLDLKIANIKKV